MQAHQAFSLTTILNTNHLQPEVYQHIIHEIKSPLQEQSFDRTNDHSRSYEHIPPRPNIPPPPAASSPLARPNNQQFSRTYDSMSVDLQQSRNLPQRALQDAALESVVSPFQHEVNQKKTNWFAPALWCGARMDSILRVEDVDSQIYVPFRNQNYKRRPIFQKQNKLDSKTEQVPLKISRIVKSVEYAREALMKVEEPELATFLELMGSLEQDLRQIGCQKLSMEKDLLLIYERLSAETNFTSQVSEQSNSHTRIMRRLHSRNTGQLVRKVLGKGNRQSQLEGERHLEQLFTRLNSIEMTLSEFIQRKDSLVYMDTVYKFISENFKEEVTFKAQLGKLYDSLGISIETTDLQFIWQHCGTRQLEKAEFIEGLTLNSFIVREGGAGNFEEEMQLKGFSRNDS